MRKHLFGGVEMSRRFHIGFYLLLVFSLLLFSMKPSLTNRMNPCHPKKGIQLVGLSLGSNVNSAQPSVRYRGSFETSPKKSLPQPTAQVSKFKNDCSFASCGVLSGLHEVRLGFHSCDSSLVLRI
jgi:hypothetical protein